MGFPRYVASTWSGREPVLLAGCGAGVGVGDETGCDPPGVRLGCGRWNGCWVDIRSFRVPEPVTTVVIVLSALGVLVEGVVVMIERDRTVQQADRLIEQGRGRPTRLTGRDATRHVDVRGPSGDHDRVSESAAGYGSAGLEEDLDREDQQADDQASQYR